ncbi:hypothetical protein ABK040_002572 [Willaertia magna]
MALLLSPIFKAVLSLVRNVWTTPSESSTIIINENIEEDYEYVFNRNKDAPFSEEDYLFFPGNVPKIPKSSAFLSETNQKEYLKHLLLEKNSINNNEQMAYYLLIPFFKDVVNNSLIDNTPNDKKEFHSISEIVDINENDFLKRKMLLSMSQNELVDSVKKRNAR